MVSQYFCGVFANQQDAQVKADYYRRQTFDVTGPTQFDAGMMTFATTGAQGKHGFGQSWLVVATLTPPPAHAEADNA